MRGNALRRAVAAALPKLRAVSEPQSAAPRAPGKWSPREVLGHLIDSASNNHQRFVRARQYWYREVLAVLLQRPQRAVLLEKIARARLRRQIPDPELREKVTPSYRIGCKRIIVSDDYHPTLTHANVELVTS